MLKKYDVPIHRRPLDSHAMDAYKLRESSNRIAQQISSAWFDDQSRCTEIHNRERYKGPRTLRLGEKKKRLTEFRIIRKVTRTFIYAAAATRYITDDKFRVSCISPNVKKQKTKKKTKWVEGLFRVSVQIFFLLRLINVLPDWSR